MCSAKSGPAPTAASDLYDESILSSDELRQMFMQREYTSRDVQRLLISHAALINKVKWLESAPALRMLRDAWNAHMETCPQHAALPDLPAPTWEDLQAWRNAPSGTASA